MEMPLRWRRPCHLSVVLLNRQACIILGTVARATENQVVIAAASLENGILGLPKRIQVHEISRVSVASMAAATHQQRD
ncbi:hypothetical protein DMC47_10655 [Nostoc sp. 3335mG]|nr:hypothetical protein DMC47_10655 [Nostoc sp. 3335mG]